MNIQKYVVLLIKRLWYYLGCIDAIIESNPKRKISKENSLYMQSKDGSPKRPVKKCPPAPSFDDTREKCQSIIDKDNRIGYSLNPATGNAFDATVGKEAFALFKEMLKFHPEFDPKKDIDFIAITNHEGRTLDREVESAFNQVLKFSNTPIYGAWEEDGQKYLDVSYPVQASHKVVMMMAKHYAQKSVLRMFPNGDHEFIETE